MRLESKFKVSRLAKYAIIIYIMISLFYTTKHYFSIHHVKPSTNNVRKQDINQRMNALPRYQEPVPNVNRINQIEKSIMNQVTWPGAKGK